MQGYTDFIRIIVTRLAVQAVDWEAFLSTGEEHFSWYAVVHSNHGVYNNIMTLCMCVRLCVCVRAFVRARADRRTRYTTT